MKPLLAETLEDITKANLPMYASPKLDGIRVLIVEGVALSRNLKPIRNRYVQSIIGKPEFNGFDGEILVGDPFGQELFRNTSSGVMSFEGEPDFTFWVFDLWDCPDVPYAQRLTSLALDVGSYPERIKVLPHKWVSTVEELIEVEKENFEKGFEGTMIRDPEGRYKYGRSTLKEGILLKLKRFRQDEAVIVGFHERMHNANEAKTNALGRTERSTHKENMVGRNDLGAVEVSYGDKTFTIGSGFNDDERRTIWENQSKYLGKTVTFKWMEYGDYEVPRFPIFVGFRDPDDMSK